MPSILFRTASEGDFATLAEKYEELNATYYRLGYLLPHPENVGQAWLDSFRRTLGRFSNVFLAEFAPEAGQPAQMAGFALCRVKRLPAHLGGILVGELADIWIAPEARRLGLGRQLTQMVLDWLQAQKVHSVEVQVLRDNQPAWSLFEQMGFRYELRAARLIFDKESPGDA